MGRLVKSHWARLVVLSAAAYHFAAAIESFFWPKIFWDFLTKNFDGALRPVPFLQIINITMAGTILAWEWPLGYIAGTAIHRSLKARFIALPLAALCAVLLYQATNSAIYYVIGTGLYLWAYQEGEVLSAPPWTLPAVPATQIEV